MPRTESYLLRLTPEEKNELGNRAREQGLSIAKLIRQRLALDAGASVSAKRKPVKLPPPSLNVELDEQGAVRIDRDAQYTALVAKHRPFMSQPKAEAKARKELES